MIGAMDDRLDPDVARTLRQRLLDEFRSEAEDAENDARAAALRSRTMGHVAHECMTRGRHVAVALFARTISGPVVHARGDLAVVGIGDGRYAYVRLTTALSLRVLTNRSPGRSRDPSAPPSFLAALRMLEIMRTDVEVLAPFPAPPRGALAAVAPDHVVLDMGDESLHVPLSWVGAVLTCEPETTTRGDSPNFPWLGVS